MDGKAVPGYLDEQKVPADSRCETFVALRTEVQTTGAGPVCPSTCAPASGWPVARHTSSSTSARCQHPVFPGANRANKLVIKLQPEDGLELHLLAAKGSGPGELLAPVSLDLDFDKAFSSERVGGYERLLLDAIAGRLNLFVRSDEQEQAWRWVEPILHAWAQNPAARAPTRPAAGPGHRQRLDCP